MIEKAKIRCILDSALLKLKEHNRLSDAEAEEFQVNFDNSNLVIGVVGKMKAGKSSLINAVIFNDAVLPSGSEPITVTLTEMTYGETDSVEVELLNSTDIEELKRLSSLPDSDEKNAELIRNARETLHSLPTNYEQLISKGKVSISLSELANYVSTTGKLSGLAKVVHITIHNDSLKGITIVDTPGFNDPVVSRGETTKKSLSKCNVLLFVHNHNGYDQVDASLLQDQIEYAGISELIDIYNKVDLLHIPLAEWEDQLEYFIERREEYLKKFSKETNIATITANSQSILMSSLMALCGQIPVAQQTPFLKQNKSRYEEEYDELTNLSDGETIDSKLIEISNVNMVIDCINRVAKNSANYLSEAPLLTLKGKLESVIQAVKDEIAVAELKIASLEESVDSAIKEKEGIASFFDEVKADIEVNPLSSELNSEITNTFNALCAKRISLASQEFSEENYPDPRIGQSGVTKHNLGNYNTFVSVFENELRDSEYDLLSSLRSRTNAYVKSLRLILVNTHISEKRRELFEKSLSKSMNEIIDEINILINQHSITSLPIGNLNQWALLKNKFLEDFNDKYLQSQLSVYREKAATLGDPSQVRPILTNLRTSLLNALSATPAQKEREKESTLESLSVLNKDLKTFEGLLSEISNILKNK